ncbi:shikimate dehydrogenase [bacterium BMS3Bbin10]|nr:shikimate dehydrogenase [bacterium BMS3Bbin10]HDL17133.1 shikimate dehydrogenase [Hyphomicrobiales bacterium]
MTLRACVIGWPVEHSRSPLIHGHWLRQYGIDGAYTKEAVAPDELAEFLSQLEARGFAGANVTVPHKEAALAAADREDDAARAIGAANTLWFENGRLHASNTDAYGFLANLDEGAPGWDDPKSPALVLGAGGAARAVVYALISRGFGEIRLVNRTGPRAEALAAHFDGPVQALDWDGRSGQVPGCGLVVNTTTLGMTGAARLGIDLSGAGETCVVADLVYAPLRTELLEGARALGLRTVDGLGMLLHQAVPGFEKWFGVRPRVTRALRDLVVADIEEA